MLTSVENHWFYNRKLEIAEKRFSKVMVLYYVLEVQDVLYLKIIAFTIGKQRLLKNDSQK